MKAFIFTVLFMMVAQSAMADGKPPRDAVSRLNMVHHSTILEKYNAIESAALWISLDNNLTGFIEGKVCDSCKKIRLRITSETKAYANRKEVSLKKAKARAGRYATVIYEVKTHQVSAIRW